MLICRKGDYIDIELLLVGDELLSGRISDQNGSWLSGFLFKQGISLKRITIINDDLETFISAVKEILGRSDAVITSGGLGPTLDDLTKLALAKLFNEPLEANDEALKITQENYRRKGKNFDKESKLNNSYEFLPQSVFPLNNPDGYAPGLGAYYQDKPILCAPGVPREFKSMVEKEFLPLLTKKYKTIQKKLQWTCRTIGIPEEKIYFDLAPNLWEELGQFGSVSSYPQIWGIDIVVTYEESDLIAPRLNQIVNSSKIKDYIWQIGNLSLEELVIKNAIEKNITISVAESCTGGLISSRLTDVPGSSKIFKGNITSYSNEAKINLLEVKPKTLNSEGAVSESVVEEMALGVLKKLNSNISVSTSGIAGPDGGSSEKPVGTLALGWATKNGRGSEVVKYSGNRKRLKNIFTQKALFKLLELINQG